jgi:hypothetical protein
MECKERPRSLCPQTLLLLLTRQTCHDVSFPSFCQVYSLRCVVVTAVLNFSVPSNIRVCFCSSFVSQLIWHYRQLVPVLRSPIYVTTRDIKAPSIFFSLCLDNYSRIGLGATNSALEGVSTETMALPLFTSARSRLRPVFHVIPNFLCTPNPPTFCCNIASPLVPALDLTQISCDLPEASYKYAHLFLSSSSFPFFFSFTYLDQQRYIYKTSRVKQ